ncbi:hypothetical protein [Massilia sp. KIM]|uniref:hypothetical protein n=1 Tax=Massilia sp. KIM TaxID=1955422 RepID=UPI00117D1C4D|nr:hypothetical protein [Massilia sp. KIM]
MSEVMLRALRNLIANDGYAMTFHSMNQYRAALVRHFDNGTDAPKAKYSRPALLRDVRCIHALAGRISTWIDKIRSRQTR